MIDSEPQNLKLLLSKYDQEHLIYFYDDLEQEEKEKLIGQIKETDFEYLKKLYQNSYKDENIEINRISPIEYYTKAKIDVNSKRIYELIGEKIVKEGKIAIITLAGGMGSRLGYKGPKGCYEIDIPPKKSLFEFICDKLIDAYKKYGVYLKWYIMTSPSNDEKTREYFEKKNYFNYPREKVFFFQQDTINILDTSGKVMLENEYTLKKDSNGNGDVFRAFMENDLEKTLDNIELLSISGVDNIILDIIDPIFIGIAVYHKSDIAAKSVQKEDVNSKDWVFAKVDGKPSIIDPKYLTDEMKNSDKYNQINILSHLFTKEAFIKSSSIKIPYNRAYKKNDFINEEGMKIVAKEPNSFKFEKFIFNVFPYFDKLTLLEVNADDDFSPIKSFIGDATPESALEKYLKKRRKK